jgi:hypothetical protein
VIPIRDADATETLIGFVDVIHSHPTAGGCAAGLMVVNTASEPLEFVFTRSTPGCEGLPLRSLWPGGSAERAETRSLVRALLDACRTPVAALVTAEDRIDLRLLSLEIGVDIPIGTVRSDAVDVVRWVPAQTAQNVREALEQLSKRAPLFEPLERVGRGLAEVYGTAES